MILSKYMRFVFLALLCSLSIFLAPAKADLHSDLVSVCASENPKRIGEFCLQYVHRETQKSRWDNKRIGELIGDKNLKLACWMGHYFSSIKWKGMFSGTELKDSEFIRWIIDRPEIFEKLLFADRPNSNSLNLFYRIWLKEEKNLDSILLNLALGAALSVDSLTRDESLARYDFYKMSSHEKKLFPQFATLEPWEYAFLFRNTESVEGGLDSLAWGQEYISKKKQINASNVASKACGLIPYKDKNSKGISVHSGSIFYDNKPKTLKIYTEYGGVCGAVSKAACGFLKSKGIPCYTIGQPGHCAFIWKSLDGNWAIGNNIHGWAWSSGNHGLPWSGPVPIIKLISRFKGIEATSSNLYFYLSKCLANSRQSFSLLEKSIEIFPRNYPAWKLWLRIQTKQASEVRKKELALNVRKHFKNDPTIVRNLIYDMISFDWNKTSPYEICALLLDENESPDSNEIYMKKIWEFVLVDIPGLKLSYDEKNKFYFFKLWNAYYEDNKISLRLKRQTCIVLQKILAGLVGKEKTYAPFLELYEKNLQKWKDKALMREADQFLRIQLNYDQTPFIRKKLLTVGLLLAELCGDRQGTKFYIEKSTAS